MNRRQFFSVPFWIIGSATLRGSSAAVAPHIDFPTGAREGIAVASYPFRKFLDSHKGKLTLLEFPKVIADRYGISGIEPLDEHFASTTEAYLTKFNSALAQSKAHVVNIPVGLGGSLYDPDEAKRTRTINKAMHWIDVAAFLASPSIRPHLQGTKHVKTDVRVAAESLRILGEYGATKKVVVHLENDSPTTEDAFLLADIISKANTPWVRALPDFGNSMAA